ncbi:MAG: hypothetical protein H6558_18235 [Lewinellaceae bacterium]|nr:hypothetical protein [Lewinellaceae bacterium]MCB9287974.1 hypothetical protein [Lewinellaceae bacterium]
MAFHFPVKSVALCCFVLISWQIEAQRHHIPDEDQVELAQEKSGFCQPGVRNQSRGRGVLIEYGGIGSHTLLPDNALSKAANSGSRVSHVEQMKAKIKIPIVNAPGLKVLAGYEYGSEKYHFSSFGTGSSQMYRSLDDNPLRNNKFSLYITKAFRDKYYGGLRLRTSYRGDYDQKMSFESQYATYSALAVFGVKPRPDLEWGVGLTYSDNFFNRQVLPFAIYNRTFNDKWGIETVLPVSVMGRYNFREGRLLLFGAEYQSDSYAIDVLTGKSEQALPYYFRRSEIAVKASYDHNLYSWFWFNVEGGYQIPFRNEFVAPGGGPTTRNSTKGQPFVKVGIFVTPPRECVR